MYCGCECEECKLIQDINLVVSALVWCHTPEFEDTDRSLCEGRKAGLIFRYNEIKGLRVFR